MDTDLAVIRPPLQNWMFFPFPPHADCRSWWILPLLLNSFFSFPPCRLQKLVDDLKHEAAMLSRLRHPNIVRGLRAWECQAEGGRVTLTACYETCPHLTTHNCRTVPHTMMPNWPDHACLLPACLPACSCPALLVCSLARLLPRWLAAPLACCPAGVLPAGVQPCSCPALLACCLLMCCLLPVLPRCYSWVLW